MNIAKITFGSTKHLSRRRFLRGAGTALALPYLEAIGNTAPVSKPKASSKTVINPGKKSLGCMSYNSPEYF